MALNTVFQGLKDIPAVFFYLLISVVIHAIIQEYLLDKVNKKLHLSKVKHVKFNESGQLLAFYLMSLVWAGDIILRENLFSVAALWEGYPLHHASMSFLFKIFFSIQISYWLHIFPELYFQKTKREDWAPRIQYACLYLAFIVGAYLTSFTRLALFLLFVQYLAEAVFHTCRILDYAEKTAVASKLFRLGDLLFVLARLSSVILAVLTFWFGLASLPMEQQVLDLATGNFNTGLVRLNCLLAVCLLQAWLMWNFIMFQVKQNKLHNNPFGSSHDLSCPIHCSILSCSHHEYQVKRAREAGPASSSNASAAGKSSTRKTEQERAKARKERKEQDDLPEADQKLKVN